jgi:hypothetical protein
MTLQSSCSCSSIEIQADLHDAARRASRLVSAPCRFLSRFMMAVDRSNSRASLAVMTHHMADYGTLGGALDYASGRCRHRRKAQGQTSRAQRKI